MCHEKFLHLLVLYFLPLIVTTIPGGVATVLLQTVVADAVCSVPVRNTVDVGDTGDGVVTAVGGASQTSSEAALQIVP